MLTRHMFKRLSINPLLAAGLLAAGLSTAGAETILIQDATVHTVGSKGVMENTDILVADGVVKSLGTDLRAPEGARVIVADGRPVTPGLWAGISAIGTAEVSGVEESVDSTNDLASMHPEFDVSLAYHIQRAPVARSLQRRFHVFQLTQNSATRVDNLLNFPHDRLSTSQFL